MNRRTPSFITILLGLGAVLLLMVVGHIMIRGPHIHPLPAEWNVEAGDPQRGQVAIVAHGCGACHAIPGIRGADGRVGPQLRDFRNQIYIAGLLPNTPENLIFWIQHPQQVNPRTAMPDLQITEEDARDIAAYLYTLSRR